ncbi:MAG: RnfABCDGE type electron transport complex subunit D [Candidatus Omnitrophica bacterium]|nr:RnfABCDGE type electron transport complex subunit D [Candidatus Omnitrophota bacterium]
MENTYFVTHAPHLHKNISTPKIIWSVFAALVPSGIAGIIIFGLRSLYVIIVSTLSAMAFEVLIQKLRGQEISLKDGSSALTGLLLAYNLPGNIPLWIPLAGSFFAIAIVKQAFGGLGRNIFNPALAARAFLLVSWPKYMTSFVKPFSPDAVTSATPLTLLKDGKISAFMDTGLTYWDMFLGKRGGCIGEVCILALLIGAIFLLWKGYISWHIPFTFIASALLFSWVFDRNGLFKGDLLFSLFSGGLVLGAFFMATDYVTSPLTARGKLVFGVGCGVLTFVIRRWGGYPEGVSFSILIMNSCTALLERYLRPRAYGTKLKV